MGEVPLPLHLDAGLMEELEREAREHEMSAADLARYAIARYLAFPGDEEALLAERDREADQGAFISEEAMLAWMARLEENPDTPPPEPDIFIAPRE